MKETKMKTCSHCGEEIAKGAKICPKCGAKNKKPIYLRPWFIAVIVVIIIGAALSGGGNEQEQQTPNTTTESSSTQTTNTEKQEEDIPTEYKSALKKAQSYSDNMYMSKEGIYDQLVSEYGEQFSEKAAKYAVKHVKADWKKNALEKAKSYQNDMDMSPEAIRDQLTSEYGEKFTQEQADWAIDHLND